MLRRLILLLAAAVLGLASAQGQIEIFSWWAGDEGPALEALIARYEADHPGVEVINATVTGGSGVNARAVLKTRMLGGDPPDSFQVHAGQELIGTWVVADRMEDLTFLYEEMGWLEKYPQGLIDLMSTDEGIWSVPVNIHRSNVHVVRPAKLEEWGVTPRRWDDFLAVCPTIQAAGVTPLALGENWTQQHLWESVALGVLGADDVRQALDGRAPLHRSGGRGRLGRLRSGARVHQRRRRRPLWQQATDMVVGGDAAFNIMGDWAAGYMSTTLGLDPASASAGRPRPARTASS
jgi:glucose/mannose transport system substrate-binding protein